MLNKKIVSLALVGAMVFSLTACGKVAEIKEAGEQLASVAKEVSTAYEEVQSQVMAGDLNGDGEIDEEEAAAMEQRYVDEMNEFQSGIEEMMNVGSIEDIAAKEGISVEKVQSIVDELVDLESKKYDMSVQEIYDYYAAVDTDPVTVYAQGASIAGMSLEDYLEYMKVADAQLTDEQIEELREGRKMMMSQLGSISNDTSSNGNEIIKMGDDIIETGVGTEPLPVDFDPELLKIGFREMEYDMSSPDDNYYYYAYFTDETREEAYNYFYDMLSGLKDFSLLGKDGKFTGNMTAAVGERGSIVITIREDMNNPEETVIDVMFCPEP